jgi:hypothetical protein
MVAACASGIFQVPLQERIHFRQMPRHAFQARLRTHIVLAHEGLYRSGAKY